MTFALLLHRENQAVLSIKVGVQPTPFALDAFADLPQSVCPMGGMLSVEGSINAGAVQELVEQLFIGPFVDGLVAFGALQVTCSLLKMVNIRSGWMFLLELKQRGNAAGSGGFLSNCPLRWEVRFRGKCCELCTVFLKPVFDHGGSQSLVHPRLASVALVAAAVGLPLMFARLPWLLALSDEGLFPLLGFVANCSAWLGVQVVILVIIDFGQTCSRMLVDLEVILVEDALPGFFVWVVDAGCPLPSS